MNIYARFFEQDVLAHNIEELVDFLSKIPDIKVNKALIEDINHYASSDIVYPKRYKVRPKVYFILIKTNAESLEEFKENKQTNATPTATDGRKESRLASLAENKEGWYKGSITFKRVTMKPDTGKFQYQDTSFTALVKAESGQDCYERIVEHLKNRQNIDPRSQFPSAKGNNFKFSFISPVSEDDEMNNLKSTGIQNFTEE